MSAEQISLFELIRREGLIVVALAALVWQVYWLTNTTAEQDRLWREELASYRTEASQDLRKRMEATQLLTAEITKMYVRLGEVEKACLVQLEEESL